MNSITNALNDMKLEDDSEEWINKLNQETAFNEAKTEIALENAKQVAEKAEQEEAFRMSEAEMQKIAAEEMVARMKAELASEEAGGLTGNSGFGNEPVVEQLAGKKTNALLSFDIDGEGNVLEKEKTNEEAVDEVQEKKRKLFSEIDFEGDQPS